MYNCSSSIEPFYEFESLLFPIFSVISLLFQICFLNIIRLPPEGRVLCFKNNNDLYGVQQQVYQWTEWDVTTSANIMFSLTPRTLRYCVRIKNRICVLRSLFIIDNLWRRNNNCYNGNSKWIINAHELCIIANYLSMPLIDNNF